MAGLLRDPPNTFRACADRYGDVVRFPLAHRTFYLVGGAEHAQHVLQDHADRYSKQTRTYRKLKTLVGNGLLTSEGACWRRQRRQAQPAFHRHRLAKLDEGITALTLEMLQQWGARAERGEALDGGQEMTRLTLAIVGRALLGTQRLEQVSGLTDALEEMLHGLYRRIERPLSAGEWLQDAPGRRPAQTRRRVDRLIEAIVAEHRADPPEEDDLLSRLIRGGAGQKQGGGGQELRSQIMTFLVAGHETTASALSWTLFLLATHRDCAGRLVAELREVLGGRVPTHADLPHLSYTRMVLLEAMRMFPPVWLIERRAEQADVLGEVAIPAGATLALCQYVTHRDPRYWKHPDRFEPERFAAARCHDRPRYAYFPFGGAARHCIGDHFALVEAQLILATLWQHYHVRLASGRAVRPRAGITLRPQGLWIELVKP